VAKPEEKVVAKLKRDLRRFGDATGLTVMIDKPPATRYNSNGRPDLFVDLGPFPIRIECKAQNGMPRSPLQEDYAEERDEWMPRTCYLVGGLDGAEVFIRELPNILEKLQACTKTKQMIAMNMIRKVHASSTTRTDSP